jgi:thiamine biosynthesis protein ThiS
MNVICNNKKIELEEGTTVAQLIQSMNYRRAAVWVNGKQLLASDYDTRVINQEDQIKILRIVAGG